MVTGLILVAMSTETTYKQGGLGDDHLGLGGDHYDLNEDEGGFVEAVHRSSQRHQGGKARRARQARVSQGKARVWKLFQRMLSGAQRSSATEKHSEQELSRRRTFRVLDH